MDDTLTPKTWESRRSLSVKITNAIVDWISDYQLETIVCPQPTLEIGTMAEIELA